MISLKENILKLTTSDIWKKSKKMQKWFCRNWLPKYEMWVEAFRTGVLEIIVNTTNGVERMNKEFKKHVRNNPDKSLIGMVTELIENFLPTNFRKYSDNNIYPLGKYCKYDSGGDKEEKESTLPVWCRDRPRNFQHHINNNYIAAKTLSKCSFGFGYSLNDRDGPKWSYFSLNRMERYTISFGKEEDFPHCGCIAWRRHMWPCKHMCKLLADGVTNWDDWSKDYISSPYFNLDSDVLAGNHCVPTYNYKPVLLLSNPDTSHSGGKPDEGETPYKYKSETELCSSGFENTLHSLDQLLPENFDKTYTFRYLHKLNWDTLP